jgi:hypothetical protein
VRFDVTPIPAATRIKSAILRIYCRSVSSATTNPKMLNAYFVMESWVEGTMTGTGTADGATWRTRNGTTSWASLGGHYYADWAVPGREEASSLSPLPAGFAQGWVTFDITPAVQHWVDNGPASNNGMLIRMPTTSSSDILQFDSRQSVSGTAPQLVVVYQ